jgi:hypothetical protein
MYLEQLVNFFKDELKMERTAKFFENAEHDYDSVVVDGYIECDFVERYCIKSQGSTELWRKVQSNVVTLVGCKF